MATQQEELEALVEGLEKKLGPQLSGGGGGGGLHADLERTKTWVASHTQLTENSDYTRSPWFRHCI